MESRYVFSLNTNAYFKMPLYFYVKMYDKQNMACYTAMLIFNTSYTLISNLVVCNNDSCLWIKAQIYVFCLKS